MAKITSMTAEQTAEMFLYRDDWMANGVSTARVDPESSRAMVRSLYEAH